MKQSIIINILRILPIFGIISCIGFIIKILVNRKNLSTDKNSNPEDIVNRTQNRGMLVSLISAIVLNLVGIAMTKMNVPESMIITNYGFIFGPILGFLLDIGVGTDNGLILFKENIFTWFKYILSNLVSGKFLRFILTVLLDLFISNPLQDIMKKVISPIVTKMGNMDKYTKFVSKNIPSLLQSIVGFVTFNAYTNQTRFNWAYPGNLPEKYLINSKVILLITSVVAVMFSMFYINSNELPQKLIYTLSGILLAFGLNFFGLDRAKEFKKEENDLIKISNTKAIIGLIVFIIIFIFGVIYPFLSGNKN